MKGLFGEFWTRRRPTHALSQHMPFYPWQRIPNQITLEGAEALLKMALQAATGDVAAGGNFYVGLCRMVAEPLITYTMTDVSNEPTSAGGYARQATTRDATGWPTLLTVNNVKLIRTKTLTFTASGADFDEAHNRLFLTDELTGTAGVLYAISGKRAVNQDILDGTSLDAFYQIGWR